MILEQVIQQLAAFNPSSEQYAQDFVARLLKAAQELGASDIHLQPSHDGLEINARLDGVLQTLDVFPVGEKSDIINRLKVMAGLLTYRTDIPQEGRLRQKTQEAEMRLSTFPTLHGERAVVRIFAEKAKLSFLADLGFAPDVRAGIDNSLGATSGAFVVAGPAGSGKTTTCYACLRELLNGERERQSIVTLEDPIEVALAGVAQSQIQATSDFTLAAGLRSLMRQDPDVILVGEMRDKETAEAVLQASLTGHLVLTTFHAGSAATAVNRLLDMGIESYLLRSGLLSVLSQRLLRRLCTCATESNDELLGLPLAATTKVKRATGCRDCHQTGYRGRLVVAELLPVQDDRMGAVLLQRPDSQTLERVAQEHGMTTCLAAACRAIDEGVTTPREARRVFGFSSLAGSG